MVGSEDRPPGRRNLLKPVSTNSPCELEHGTEERLRKTLDLAGRDVPGGLVNSHAPPSASRISAVVPSLARSEPLSLAVPVNNM